jgi:hypothetical protein
MADCHGGDWNKCQRLFEFQKELTFWRRLATEQCRRRVKVWYTWQDLEANRKVLAVLFHCESQEKGQDFNQAVIMTKFSKLNHYILNTEAGKSIFPGMTLDNLRILCESKISSIYFDD